MNESAPAPVRPPVPWWERVAAAVLAVVWVARVLVPHGSVAGWWEGVVISASHTARSWEGVIQTGSWGPFAEPGSKVFVHAVWLASLAFTEFARVCLFAGSLWVASGRGPSRLRTVFWLAALGHGYLGLGSLAAQGRFFHLSGIAGRDGLDGRVFLDPDTFPWHGGWLDAIDASDNPYTWPSWMAYLFQILVVATVLSLGRWCERRALAAAATTPTGAA